MFGQNGISTLVAPHSAIANSVQRLNVKVTSSQGEIAMPMTSADTYRLSIQVPASWLMPNAPRTSASAMDVTWSLNSEVMAAMRTPPRPNKGLISTGSANSFHDGIGSRPGTSLTLSVRKSPNHGATLAEETSSATRMVCVAQEFE